MISSKALHTSSLISWFAVPERRAAAPENKSPHRCQTGLSTGEGCVRILAATELVMEFGPEQVSQLPVFPVQFSY